MTRVSDGKSGEFWKRKRGGRCSVSAILGTRRSPPLQLVIECFRLITSSITARACHIGAITTEQDAHMHFVSFGFEPAKKSTHAVPTVVLVIVIGVFTAAFLPLDDEILIGLGQFLERPVDIDFLAHTSAE